MGFRFHKLAIPEVVLIEADAFKDSRGFFMETYKRSAFVTHGLGDTFVQDNYSHSVRGTLRGLHYQKRPKAQAKLVAVLKGEIFDVAVDVRRGSPTYGRWVGETLSTENFRMLYIPAGFAHGFCVLSEEADVLYKVTNEYAPELDRGVIWNDPDIGIRWPTDDPTVSQKDAGLPRLCAADIDFLYEEIGP
ncbi:MAG: dTDP-4-dehydrorhamnose 3,5-epimerase [Candidatus Binatia bacterium]